MNRLAESSSIDDIDSLESFLTNCLRVAAERYQKDATDCRDGTNGMADVPDITRTRLSQQFDLQHKQALTIASRISAHGLVELCRTPQEFI